MPIYDFVCEADGAEAGDVYLPFTSSEAPSCPKCGKGMERVLSLSSRHVGSSAFPYVTKNLTPDGSPVEVRSERHLQELCKRYGKTHRPDSAWITKEYVGYDWRTGKQIYTEGSGRGMPGCWE